MKRPWWVRIHATSGDGGAAAVEFGLIALPLTLLVIGLINFGILFDMQLKATQAAREGVRISALAAIKDNSKVQIRVEQAYGCKQGDSKPCPIMLENNSGCDQKADRTEVKVNVPVTGLAAKELFGLVFPTKVTATAVMRCGG